MSLTVSNNIIAMIGHRNLLNVQDKVKKSLERLSSGFRINRAADDAAGIAIRSRMRADIASYKQAGKNASQATSLIQVAEGALSTIDNILVRMKELSVQASSANTSSNLDKLNSEFTSLNREIDRISSSTKYADMALLDGSLSQNGLNIQLGAGNSAEDTLSIEVGDATLVGLGLATASDSQSVSGSEVAKAGNEFQVNTFTDNEQQYQSVTGLTDGGFVVTWESYGQDGSGYGIYGQRYNSDGSTSGSEFRVNSTTNLDQGGPSVTGLADGGFVVTWHSDDQDGSYNGVYGQRYNSSGAAVGSEFRINSVTADVQWWSSVTGLSDGGFVVTWQSSGQDGSLYGVYGQRYDSSGNTAGTEFLVNTETTSSQELPSVTALADGGFVVTWNSLDQDGSSYGVYGQAYDSAGNTVGSEFQINTETDNFQYHPSVAGLTDGGFVVTWASLGQDGSSVGVYGQIFSVSGTSPEVSQSSPAGSVSNVSISTVSQAQEAMAAVDNAISKNQSIRSQLGALQNRLNYSISELQSRIENTQAAESVISDADMADEMSLFTRSSILSEAATAMLAQANMVPQTILSLLQ